MKKLSVKFISIISVLALLIVVPMVPTGTEAATPSSTADHMIRVHLSTYGSPTGLSMSATGKHTISDNGKALSGAFTVKVVNGTINIVSGGTTYVLDTDVLISAADLTPTNLIQISGGYSYAGDIRILVKNGTLKIVNHVDYETYVMGVIPYEMNNSWPIEALKAQAVAARSYAYYVSNSRNRATQEHDLVNTTASQVYHGYNASYANCIAAIKATANQILQTSSGGNVYACYAASNGGFTEYPVTSGVASSNFSYLPGNVKDDYDLTYALSHTGYSAKITVPKTLGLADLKTSVAQPYKMIREKLPAAGVNVDSIAADVPVKSIVLTNPKYTSPDRIFTGADITVTINDGGTLRDVVLSYAPIVDGTTNRPFINGILNLTNKSEFKILVVRDNGSDWTLASTRYGHGSGLSQVGCYQMAQSGLKYTDMLTFYYLTGTQTKLVTKNWLIADSSVVSGWVKSGTTWKYYSSSDTVLLGWQKLSGTWYFLDRSDGTMITGWLKDGNSWYYLSASGAMKTGWQKISGRWYLLASGDSGRMLTGWQKVSGKWYYLAPNDAGHMLTGWQKISGKWYYLNSSGAMVTGTQKIGGKTYKFNSSGVWIS